MKIHTFLLFLLVLPLTLFVDLLLFALQQGCASCGSFAQFVASDGALSFPIVVGLTEWFQRNIKNQPFDLAQGKKSKEA